MKISEMMNVYRDDTVSLEENRAVDVSRIKELTLHRIGKRKRRPVRSISVLAAVLAMVLSMSTVAWAASRGVRVTELLGSYFGGELTETQENVIEELGTTGFFDDMEENQPETEEIPTFIGVTKDGVTITPLAAMSDGYRFILKLKITMEDGTPLHEEDMEWYDLYVNLHISEQVWCPYPTRELFTKEGCGKNEVICTQDYEFGGNNVILPETINVKGLEKTASHAGSDGMIFEGDWPLNIGKLKREDTIQPALCRDSFWKPYEDIKTGEVTMCQADVLNVSLSPLTLTLQYSLTEAEDAEADTADVPAVITELEVILKDGSRISATYSGERVSMVGVCETYYMLAQPIAVDEVEEISWD